MDKVANELGFDSKQPLYDGDIYQILYHLKSLSDNCISLLPYEIIDYMIDEYMYKNTQKIIYDNILKKDFFSLIKNNNLIYFISFKTLISYFHEKTEHNLSLFISNIHTQDNKYKYKLLHYSCNIPINISEYYNDERYYTRRTDKILSITDINYINISNFADKIWIYFRLYNEDYDIDTANTYESYVIPYYPICKTRQERLLNKKMNYNYNNING